MKTLIYIITTLKNFAYTYFMSMISIDFLITLNVILLTLSVKILLQYHPYEMEATINNILLVFFMCSIPVLISSLFQYGAGKIRKFRNIIWSIFIAVIIAFIFWCIMNYLFRDSVLFLSYLIAQLIAENKLLMGPDYTLRPSLNVDPELNEEPSYATSYLTYLFTPHFTFQNGMYYITGAKDVNIQGIISGTVSAQPYASHLSKAMEHSLGHSG